MSSAKSSTQSTNEAQDGQISFKQQLDKAAREARQSPNSHKNSNDPSLLEKVTEYVPAIASKVLGTAQQKQEDVNAADASSQKDLSGPPNRPEHDEHIAEFVREQYHSKKVDNVGR